LPTALAPLGDRWAHVQGVVRQAERVAAILPAEEREVLVAAAYLHDLGYAPALIETGFHGLDGARHLRALGHERLAGLVAYHSGARGEAEPRGPQVVPLEKPLVSGSSGGVGGGT
jgi:HD superfamily phosphodiesterase